MNTRTRNMSFYSLLFFVSFFLHLIWESLHVSLYTGYDALGFGIPITIWASLGDALYTMGAFVLVSFFRKEVFKKQMTVFDFLLFAGAGLFISLFVEYKAMFLDRWEYLPAMPIIWFFGVGLSPVLQMTFLLPISVYMAMRIYECVYAKPADSS